MPHHRSRRSRALALSVAMGMGAATALVPAAAHAAPLTGTIAITTPATGKLAAGMGKQVLLLTVTGQPLSEALVTGVSLGSDPACQNIPTYIVTGPTTIAVKTPTGGCPVTTAEGGDDIGIAFAGGGTLTKTGGLFLVTPPAIAGAADRPVINDNSAMLPAENQTTRLVTNGGQTVRVRAGAGYAFDPRGTAGLAVTVGGRAAAEVKVYDGTGAQIMPNTTSAPAPGNYLTFRTATGMTAADPTLVITQNGVSRAFTAADTGLSLVAAPTVTSLSVTSGRSAAPTTTVVTGTGFSKTLEDYAGEAPAWRVQFCGVPATVTAVNPTGTALTVTTPDVSNKADGLGEHVYAGTCPVTVTDAAGNVTSPISAGGSFTFLNE